MAKSNENSKHDTMWSSCKRWSSYRMSLCCKGHCTSSSESCKLDLSCTTSLTASVSNLRSRRRYHRYLRKISAALKPVFIFRLLVTPARQDHLALPTTPERPWWCNRPVNKCPHQGSAAVCSCTASGAQLSIGAVSRSLQKMLQRKQGEMSITDKV